MARINAIIEWITYSKNIIFFVFESGLYEKASSISTFLYYKFNSFNL